MPTPNPPGTLLFPLTGLDDSLGSLIHAVNNAATTLTTAVDNNDDELVVDSLDTFNPSEYPAGALSVQGEIIYYSSVSTAGGINKFTGCERGCDGTTAVAHAAGVVVEMLMVAAHHNILAEAIEAIEFKLGYDPESSSPASSPTNGTLLQGTGSSTSAWTKEVFLNGVLGVGVSSPAAQIHLGGNLTAASWGNHGLRLCVDGDTLTDSYSSGTVSMNALSSFGASTIAASSDTTYTNSATLYIAGAPTSGSHVTQSNPYALFVNAGNVKLSGLTYFGSGSGSPEAKIHISSNDLSAPAWSSDGIAFRSDRGTYTDTTSSGTADLAAIHGFGRPILAASNTTTFAVAANLYIHGSPTAGSHVTITDSYSLYINGNASWFGGTIKAGTLIQVGAATGSDWPQLLRDSSGGMIINTSAGASTGHLGIGVSTAQARLHLGAGTTSANSAPLKFNSGSLLSTAEAGVIEYDDRFYVTESDTTRRFLVQAASATKVTSGAPFTNNGYITVVINGTNVRLMTTA